MTNINDVIKGLECKLNANYDTCKDCQYFGEELAEDYPEFQYFCNRSQIEDDALELLKAQEPITGETSDGYHTFNELYHHRAVLFSVIVANYPDRAWKSKKHYDGTMYEGMFIVGIETPDGQATYHYDIAPYWDMFKCRVLDNAPEWDGHTPAQAIERIGKLKAQELPAVLLNKLCEWMAGNVYLKDDTEGAWELNPDNWKKVLTKWTEEQDESN